MTDPSASLIDFPVGQGSVNRPADLPKVQHLLNLSGLGGAALQEDGVAGKLTVARICSYQATVLRHPASDGRVDPGGRTLRSLTERAALRNRRATPAPSSPGWVDALGTGTIAALSGNGPARWTALARITAPRALLRTSAEVGARSRGHVVRGAVVGVTNITPAALSVEFVAPNGRRSTGWIARNEAALVGG